MALCLAHAWTPYGGRWVVLDGAMPLDYRISRNDDQTGAVIEGRVVEFLPHLSAAFVDIGTDRAGFLRGVKTLHNGQKVRVRVRAEARAEKGAILQQAGEDTPLCSADPLETILSDYPAIDRLLTDDDAACARWGKRLSCQVVSPSPLEETPLAETLDSLLSPWVLLPCGGRMILETTTALTTVDVDSATASPERANDEAADALALHLRLRNIAGAVVVDFVPQGKKSEYRRGLINRLKEATADDLIPTQILGTGPLGLVELRRERRRLSLADRLSGPSGQAMILLDRLWQAVRHAPATGPAWTLRVSPAVAEAIHHLTDNLTTLEQRTGRRPRLDIDPNRADNQGLVET